MDALPTPGEVFESARLVALLDRVRASLPLHAQQERTHAHALERVVGCFRCLCCFLVRAAASKRKTSRVSFMWCVIFSLKL